LEFTRGADQQVGFLIEELAIKRGGRVLDVGTGAGRHAVEFARRGMSVAAVDISARLLEIALDQAREADVAINFVHGDAREMDFAQRFDAAICLCEGAFGLLENDRENARVLKSTRAQLHDGAAFALSVLNVGRILAHRDQHPGFDVETRWELSDERMLLESGKEIEVTVRDRSFDRDEIVGIVEAASFRVRDVWGICPPRPYARDPIDKDCIEMLVLAEAV